MIVLLALLPLWAQAISPSRTPVLPEGFSADALLRFADQLLDEGEYFRAITEYQRFLTTYPNDSRRPRAHFRIGQAFYHGQSYADALRTFQEAAQQYPDTPYGKQAWLWQGEALLQETHYDAADRVYTDFMARFPHDPLTSFAHYQQGWTRIYRRQWNDAAATWQQIPSTHPLHPLAQQLAAEAKTGTNLPQKSPALAGLLSAVLPGSGQLYNGRFGDAVLSFLLNSLFIVGTIEAAQQAKPAVAGALGFFAAAWYTGNVYSAVNGAHKFNRHQAEVLLHDLERRFRVPPPQGSLSQVFGLQIIRLGF